MQTTRQIERFWIAQDYNRLARELLTARFECSHRLKAELSRTVPTAALALIRLDELNQGTHPLTQKLIHSILSAQEPDGGWGEPLVTALCLRALLCSQGIGVAIDRGMTYLAELQKTEGVWPSIPIRRTAEDPFVSAFILFQLADQPAFRRAVRFDDAVAWFLLNEPKLDADALRLWKRASLRARLAPPPPASPTARPSAPQNAFFQTKPTPPTINKGDPAKRSPSPNFTWKEEAFTSPDRACPNRSATIPSNR
jgi:hypothetical protein